MLSATASGSQYGSRLFKMTAGLCNLYKTINNGITLGNTHDYPIQIGEYIHDRYQIEAVIGKGSFGQVVQAVDLYTQQRVAIKVIKNLKVFYDLAQNEIRILNFMKVRDPLQRNHIVAIQEWFVHENHQCIVFELLSSNLYEVLRQDNYRGLALSTVRHIAQQMLEALAFLQSANIMNCDIKPVLPKHIHIRGAPENLIEIMSRRSQIIMLCSDRFDVKVIDFGSSCFIDEQAYTYIQSRFYRSPEVMLGLPLGTPIDSTVIIPIFANERFVKYVVALISPSYTGHSLFNGASEAEQVAKQVAILGMPPPNVMERATKLNEYFFVNRHSQYALRTPYPGGDQTRSLASIIGVSRCSARQRNQRVAFVDLLHRMLDYDARTRIRPAEALAHPFITAFGQ